WPASGRAIPMQQPTQVRELAPELALGIAEGQERDAGLRHLSGCGGCRQLVSELSSVGDELLQLAPAHDPTSWVRVPRPGRARRAATASETTAPRPPLA